MESWHLKKKASALWIIRIVRVSFWTFSSLNSSFGECRYNKDILLLFKFISSVICFWGQSESALMWRWTDTGLTHYYNSRKKNTGAFSLQTKPAHPFGMMLCQALHNSVILVCCILLPPATICSKTCVQLQMPQPFFFCGDANSQFCIPTKEVTVLVATVSCHLCLETLWLVFSSDTVININPPDALI